MPVGPESAIPVDEYGEVCVCGKGGVSSAAMQHKLIVDKRKSQVNSKQIRLFKK